MDNRYSTPQKKSQPKKLYPKYQIIDRPNPPEVDAYINKKLAEYRAKKKKGMK